MRRGLIEGGFESTAVKSGAINQLEGLLSKLLFVLQTSGLGYRCILTRHSSKPFDNPTPASHLILGLVHHTGSVKGKLHDRLCCTGLHLMCSRIGVCSWLALSSLFTLRIAAPTWALGLDLSPSHAGMLQVKEKLVVQEPLKVQAGFAPTSFT